MRAEDVLSLPSMPAAAPSYPRGPYRFVDRQHMVILFESEPEAIRQALSKLEGWALREDGAAVAADRIMRLIGR